MNDKYHSRGQRENKDVSSRRSPRVLCLLIGSALFLSTAIAHPQTRQPLPPDKRIRYQIHLALDFENRTYIGSERVRWVNRGDHPTSILFFHLYPNVRMPGYSPPADKTQPSDEPRLEISEVRTVSNDVPLQFALDDQETTLRI